METEKGFIGDFDRYLSGTLSAAEKESFENKLATDASFEKAFNEYMILHHSLKAYGERTRLKAALEDIHRESGEIRELKRKSPLIVFFRRHSASIAIAACVSVITVISMSLLYYYLVIQNPKANFRALKRDMEKIKRDQQAIIKDIRTNRDVPPKPYNPGKYGGTGIVISPNGYIVTSYHLIRDAGQIIVEHAQGTYLAKEIYSDPYHDISVLLINDSAFSNLPAIPFAIKSRCSDLGEKVFTLGYPREDIVYGEGSISSVSGYQGDTASYQVSIPVNPGNSGGPVFDENANLIGIISGKEMSQEGAAFAIKTSYLIDAIKSIPSDSLRKPLKLGKSPGRINGRVKQISKLRDFVVIVKTT